MATGFATVKEVLSGDTLVLIGQPRNGPPPEIRLTLASLQAPRLGTMTKNGETKDEPFAWQSREFLRRACIGKYVSFKVEYTVPSINRQFGAIRLTQGSKENLCVVVAREGWAKVKAGGDEKERSVDYEEMVRVNEAAEKNGAGIFNTDPKAIEASVRKVTYEVPNAATLLDAIKGRPQRAIVEYVRDGAGFKLLLVDHMTYISFGLAGVQCPRLGGDGSSEGPEPFAREAKYFTEIRLLNRDVNVVVNGMDDRNSNFFGSIEHPAGDISIELLKNGLGKTADWSMQHTSLEKAAQMRAAQRDAKQNRARIWKDHVAPKISGDKNYEGVVSEIVSGDTVVIRTGTNEQLTSRPWECEERRVSLSSIRAPRLGGRGKPEDAQPFAEEAKELLRQRALGKKCDVSIEYERKPLEGTAGTVRKFGTVLLHTRKGKKNAALLVVEEGFADVMRHRADDERSKYYDDLQQALIAAQEAGKGIHGSGAPKAETTPAEAVIDLTNNKELAKAHLSTLQEVKGGRRAGIHKALVEYVINGSRLRLRLPGENCLINFALSGITTPSTARPAMKGRAATAAEPFAEESTSYLRSLVLQREISIEIETQDKGGTFIGQATMKKGGDRTNIAVAMIQAGLAFVNDFSVRYTSCGDELIREQSEAQRKRLNVWKDYVEPKPEDGNGVNGSSASGSTTVAWGGASNERKLDSMVVSVSEIVCGNIFFVQDQKKIAQLQGLETKLAEQGGDTTPGNASTGIMEPKKGMNCLALFDDGAGNKWFRAKILNIKREGGNDSFHVRYIDFGNEATVDMGHVKPDPSNGSLFAAQPFAQECQLAFVKVPSLDKEFGREAAICFSDVAYGKQLTAKVSGKSDEGRTYVSLFTKEEGKSDEEQSNVAVVLLQHGLGYLDSRQARYAKTNEENEIIKKLRAAQDTAHNEHVNLWRYGDPREDDE